MYAGVPITLWLTVSGPLAAGSLRQRLARLQHQVDDGADRLCKL